VTLCLAAAYLAGYLGVCALIAYAMSGKEHNETNRQGEPTSKDQTHTSEDAPETTVIKPDTPPAENNKTYTVKQKHDALDYCAFGVGVITLVVLSIYATIAALQWCQMKKATKATKIAANAAAKQAAIADKQMRVSARPYVTMGKQNGPMAEWVGSDQNRVGIKIYFHNAGNTPAKQLIVNASVQPQPGVASSYPHLSWHPLWGWFANVIPSIVVAPGQTEPEQIYNLNQIDIARGFREKEFRVVGEYEFSNVFGEYCCEVFCLTWQSGEFQRCIPKFSEPICPSIPDHPNVCRIGEAN
jgi:hypothetical protein